MKWTNAIAGAALAAGSWAASHAQEAPWPASDTVLELLKQDAQAALNKHEQAKNPLAVNPLDVPGVAAGDERDRIAVRAIYGVGKQLHAEVSINGATWRYRQGRLWPLGVDQPNTSQLYALVGISPPCLRMRWGEAPPRVVCLRSGENGHADAAH